MKAARTMAKGGKRRVRKKDVAELLHIVRGLKRGRQEDCWQAAVRASEIQEQLYRTIPPDTTETIAKMATPEGRVSLASYVDGVRRQIRGAPPPRANPFRLAPPSQLRQAPPIALEELSGRSLEDIQTPRRNAPRTV